MAVAMLVVRRSQGCGGRTLTSASDLGYWVVHPARFERATPRFEAWCSIQLSYGCISCGFLIPRKEKKVNLYPIPFIPRK